jgi:crotonobetainyl-CoA:carnitine CoA-transferase CaiB-like acyl-CoA transferase
VVLKLEEAMADPHFAMRRVFDHGLENEDGARIAAAPVAVAPQFRERQGEPKRAPTLGAHNDELLR